MIVSILDGFIQSLNWTINSMLGNVPWVQNYFWGVILISIVIWGLEILFPWRKEQKIFRKDFFVDLGYLFLNFFGFAMILNGLYHGVEYGFGKLGWYLEDFVVVDWRQLPELLSLFLFFIIVDFFQWLTHILLHHVHWLWRFHQVHHSSKEMGFATHFRYHWMENVLYKPAKILVLLVFGGIEPSNAFVIHFFAITIGHLNHANIRLSWGILGNIFNSPVFHRSHHIKSLPQEFPTGMNFAITFSLWDHLFGTAYQPVNPEQLELGFVGDEEFPATITKQLFVGFSRD